MRTGRILIDALSSRKAVVALLGLVVGLSQSPARAFEFCAASTARSYTVAAGETNRNDVYGFTESVNISGTHEGDLVVCAGSINVSGELTGDLFAGARTVTINGRVGDSTRVCANALTVTGTIDGDLLVFAQNLTLAPGSRVTGDVVAFAEQAIINGNVDGDVKASGASVMVNGVVGGDLSGTAGQVLLSGTVGKNCDLKCDTLTVDPKARIAGDLKYEARKPVDLEGKGIVGGKIRFDKKEKKAREPKGGFSLGGMMLRLWLLVASLVVGFVLIALFRRVTPSIEAVVEREIFPSLGVGFVIAVVLPVAALMVMFLVVTIPLAVMALIAWLIALYVAKLPVALWLGRRILRALGIADPSPYLGLLIGLVLLFLLFAVPYLGPVVWVGTIILGLGVLALGIRGHFMADLSGGATPPPVPSGTTA